VAWDHGQRRRDVVVGATLTLEVSEGAWQLFTLPAGDWWLLSTSDGPT
jgi:hypothetical protein